MNQSQTHHLMNPHNTGCSEKAINQKYDREDDQLSFNPCS